MNKLYKSHIIHTLLNPINELLIRWCKWVWVLGLETSKKRKENYYNRERFYVDPVFRWD